MLRYYNVISQEEEDITGVRSFYIIPLPNGRYKFCATSQNVNDMSFDPETRSECYWPLSIESINHANKDLLFPNEFITHAALSLETLIEAFGFNPVESRPVQFGRVALPQTPSALFELLRSNDPMVRQNASFQIAFPYMNHPHSLIPLFIDNFPIFLSLLSDESLQTKKNILSSINVFFSHTAYGVECIQQWGGLPIFVALLDNEDIEIKKFSVGILNTYVEAGFQNEVCETNVINKLVGLLRFESPPMNNKSHADMKAATVRTLLNLCINNPDIQPSIITAGALPLILQLLDDYRIKIEAEKLLENFSANSAYLDSIKNYWATYRVPKILDELCDGGRDAKNGSIQNLRTASTQLNKPVLNNNAYAQSLLNQIKFDKCLHELIEKIIVSCQENNLMSSEKNNAMCSLLRQLCDAKFVFLVSATDLTEEAEGNKRVFQESCLHAIETAKPTLSFYKVGFFTFRNAWLFDLETEINSVSSSRPNNAF